MINKTVEKLLYYSQIHLGLEQEDYIFYRNLLLNELSIESPFDGEIDKSEIDNLLVPDLLVDELSSYLLSIGFNEKDIEAKISKIFGLLTPLPSKVIETFNSLSDISSELATNYLFNLGIKSNYIQKTKIDSNIVIPGQIDGHDLIMTINLSKPEKNNKDIKAALSSGDSNYPMCPICITNEGCIGSKKTQPRVNLRIIPMELSNNTWYLQYSPYGYYNEHCILILKDHVPMKVDIKYISAMFEFCDKFPHYFIGANSDLPIVGGSILSHEHFQGGNYELPMLKAGIKYSINTNTDDYKLSILSWPATAFLLQGKDKEILLKQISNFIDKWKIFNYGLANIFSYTSEQHNTVTTIVRKIDGVYNCYLLPRNNYTDETHPGGLYHVRNEYQIIKNEGIGLIEAMGLFVLPARLKRQLKAVEEIVKNPAIREEFYKNSPDLKAFDHIINNLINHKYKSINDLLLCVGDGILHDIDVFKNEQFGQVALKEFINLLGYEK